MFAPVVVHVFLWLSSSSSLSMIGRIVFITTILSTVFTFSTLASSSPPLYDSNSFGFHKNNDMNGQRSWIPTISYSYEDQDPFSAIVVGNDNNNLSRMSRQSLSSLILDSQLVSLRSQSSPNHGMVHNDRVQLALCNLPSSLEEDDSGYDSNDDDNNNRIPLKTTSTGTTIAGICGEDFIVLGADSRSTAGTMVADKQCYKLHVLATNIVAAGAGTASDIDHLTRECCYTVQLVQQTQHQYGNTDIVCSNNNEDDTNYNNRQVSVKYVCRYLQDRLYEQDGACQANLIVGGVYDQKPILRAIHPHGSYDNVQYTALGSGGLAAMSILENGYYQKNKKSYNNGRDSTSTRSQMTVTDAVELVVMAISAGIVNDLGSGSQVDIVVIGPNGISKFKRCAVREETLPPNNSVFARKNDDASGLSNNDGTNQQKSNERTNDDSLKITTQPEIMDGVNGFGNLKYSIKSKRILQSSYSKQRNNIRNRWKDIMIQ